MFLPLYDHAPLRVIRWQFVSGGIIVINFLVFFITQIIQGGIDQSTMATSFGAIPALITDDKVLPANLDLIPEPLTLITYMFLHAGWLHILSNMAFIWVFADNVEDAFGHIGFLLFYLACGIIAAVAHTLSDPTSQSPLIGASGGVAGVIAAYMVLFPKARVWILLFLKIPMPIPAVFALVGWFGFQILNTLLPQGEGAPVAWWAHIGGFIAGGLIAFVLRKFLGRRLGKESEPT